MWYALYIGIFLVALMTPLWFFAACVFFYALARPGYELLFIAVLIDAQFGLAHPGFQFTYTVLTAGILVVLAFLKPQLSFYREVP